MIAERSISGRIAKAIETIEDPSPAAIGASVVDSLSPEELRHLAVCALADRVRAIMSRRRGKVVTGAPGSSRWDAVRSQNESGELDLARVTVFNGEQTKWLLDCTLSDLNGAVEDHERIATAHEASAVQFRSLADLMKRQGAEVVGDLPAHKVREIFHA